MIKLAVISDVHGNYKALEAFLAYLEEHPVQGIICLGDYVTDSPYPQRTMALLREMQQRYDCIMLRGNREDYLLQNAKEDQGWKPSSANGVLKYTFEQLTQADLDFFAGLPTERALFWEGCPSMYLCHGTPGKVRGNVTLEEGLRERAMKRISQRYLLGGHTHHQELFNSYGKVYVNPGSLGFAMNGVGGSADFAIMTHRSEKELIFATEFISIPYDLQSFLEDFTESGLDEIGMVLNRAVKKSLVTGHNFFYDAVLASERIGGGLSMGQIAETVWNQVAEELSL